MLMHEETCVIPIVDDTIDSITLRLIKNIAGKTTF